MLLGGLGGTAARRPERVHLGDDPLAELVSRPRERESRVGVQALEPAGTGLAADTAGQLRTESPLFRVGTLGAFTQRRILLRQSAPAPDPARGLEPGDGDR